MTITRSVRASVELDIESWTEAPTAPRRWTETGPPAGTTTRHVLSGLRPRARYRFTRNDITMASLRADDAGRIQFDHGSATAAPERQCVVLE